MNPETVLTLGKAGLPPCSARACIQTLYPVTQSMLFRRTLNGTLHYVGDDTHHKYGSTIRSQDKAIIALEPLWCGHVLDVGCILPITQPLTTTDPKIMLSRPAVEDSVCVYDAALNRIDHKTHDDQTIIVP